MLYFPASGDAVINAQPLAPAAPTGSAAQSFCAAASTVANLNATGTAIRWYAASSGGTALAGSTALVNGTHYYASQTVSDCESTSRLDVVATVNACNTPPVITSNGGGATATTTIAENTTLVTTVTATDIDLPAQTLTFSITGGADQALFAINGTTGVLNFVTAPNFESPADAGANNVYDVQVTVTDNGTGNLTDVQDLAITVTNVNEPPVAVADSYSVLKGGTLTVAAPGVLGNDSDPDGNTVTAIKVTDPVNGTLTLNANGSFTFIHNGSATTSDSFTYKVNDGTLDGNTVTVSITINPVSPPPPPPPPPPVNYPPVATAAPVNTAEDTPVSGAVTATDVNGDALTFSKVSDPAHGTVTVNANGTYTYTPANNYNGTDSFMVMVSDGHGGQNTATVNVTVTPVNDPPVATALPVTTLEDKPVNGTVTATDVDGDALTFSKASNPVHGTVTVNANGTYTYSPAADYFGADSFTVTVSDGNGGNVTATVNVTVTPVNDAPSFKGGGNLSVCGNAAVQIIQNWATSISTGPVNESGQSLFFVVSNNNNSIFTVQPSVNSAGILSFTPALNQTGTATVSVQIKDNGGTLNGGMDASEVQTFTITINGLPAAPTATATQNFCGSAVLANLSANAPAGSTVSWYSSNVLGTQLAGSAALTTATSYYAESVNTVTGCVSSSRTGVLAMIYEIPITPSGSQLQTFCSDEAAKVSDLVVSGLNVKWYNAASAG